MCYNKTIRKAKEISGRSKTKWHGNEVLPMLSSLLQSEFAVLIKWIMRRFHSAQMQIREQLTMRQSGSGRKYRFGKDA